MTVKIRGPVLGCIADDFTGATDLGSTLTGEGLSVVQTIGVPEPTFRLPDCDAIVVALKTRTAAVEYAVSASLEAVAWLVNQGVQRIFFKYCSTFDSRPTGNIGPVADALLEELGVSNTIVCPAFPETGRTVYRGHLFVGNSLLNESPMARHPLTPMTDSSLLRLLGAQTSRRVALIPYPVVREGASSIAAAIEVAARDGAAYLVVDALDDVHLRSIGEAVGDLRLVTGASGVARGLPDALRRRGVLASARRRAAVRVPAGPVAVLAGSTSPATREQIERFGAHATVVAVDPLHLASDNGALDRIVRDAVRGLGSRPVVVHTANSAADVRRAQATLGIDRSAALTETALGKIAVALVAAGARRLIVAGGETSAAVLQALGIRVLRIGSEIAPGVPWCEVVTEPAVAVALKSGNFGGPDFFADAIAALP